MSPSTSSKTSVRNALYLLLGLFIVFHNDLWWWDDPSFVLGFPIALTYHLGYCLAAAGLMVLLTRFAWPELDETPVDDGGRGDIGEAAVDGASKGRAA